MRSVIGRDWAVRYHGRGRSGRNGGGRAPRAVLPHLRRVPGVAVDGVGHVLSGGQWEAGRCFSAARWVQVSPGESSWGRLPRPGVPVVGKVPVWAAGLGSGRKQLQWERSEFLPWQVIN